MVPKWHLYVLANIGHSLHDIIVLLNVIDSNTPPPFYVGFKFQGSFIDFLL